MPEPMDDLDLRVTRTLDAMRTLPEVPRSASERVAARAVLDGAPAARAATWMLRAAAALAIVLLGGAVLRGTQARDRAMGRAFDTAADIAADAPPQAAMLPAAATAARPIMFELDAPDAQSVQVLGDFNHWSREATEMQRGADGRWRITTLLPPGRYIYAYLVDGRRFERDPARDAVEDRDFGVTGSELVVGEAP